MLRIANIVSERFIKSWPSYHIIYEWEDILASALNIPIISIYPFWYKILINRYTVKAIMIYSEDAFRIYKRAIESARFLMSSGKSLLFELHVNAEYGVAVPKAVIPVLIDFWKSTDLISFYRAYRECSLVLVSSLEVFQYLRMNNCPLNIVHFPLSIPDFYRIEEGIEYNKVYDIIIAGRPNAVLEEYMESFLLKYPEAEVLRQQQIAGELYYISNKRGLIGRFHTRSEYITLLRSCKIAFYSTPGIDGGEKRTGGFNPVTPRFLEMLSSQCLLVGRYQDNAEAKFYELEKVCPNIQSYVEFERVLLDYLSRKASSFSNYKEILNKHYTSCRAELLREILSKHL